MHGWEEDGGQASTPLGPLRPTAGAELVSAGMIFFLAFSSISSLLSAMPMKSQEAPGKLALLAPTPRVPLFLEAQPSCKPAWLKSCPRVPQALSLPAPYLCSLWASPGAPGNPYLSCSGRNHCCTRS